MIQWITMELWAGGNDPDHPWTPELATDMERRSREYWSKWDDLKKHLPPALVDADSRLHDAELLEAASDTDRAELRLLVVLSDGKTERWVHQGVRWHRWINHRIQLSGPPGFGHLGYSEFRLHEHGYSMAILCSSGLELVVRASGFRIEDPESPSG